MVSVTFLGTGAGDVAPDRFNASFLVQAGECQMLLDAGEPCAQRLKNLGVDPTGLDAVLLTHAHPDHVGGLPLLLQASWLAGRKEPLMIALPEHLLSPLRTWLRAVLIPEENLGFPITWHTWTAGQPLTLGDAAITPHETTHLASARQRLGDSALKSYLFDLQWPGLRIVYSGDLGAASDLRPVLTGRLDALICELSHFRPEALAETLKGTPIGSLCLTHLAREAEERSEEIVIFLNEALPDLEDTFVPDDGETLDFQPREEAIPSP